MCNKKVLMELNPAMIIFVLMIWTIFIYMIGSLYYQCECDLINLKETLVYEDMGTCQESYNQDVNDYQWLKAYKQDNLNEIK